MNAEAVRRRSRSRHPRLRDALVADARMTALYRFERHEFRSRADTAAQILRLMWVSDAFLAHVLYRIKARLQAHRIPVLPRIAHRIAMAVAQVSIGDPVVMQPGVYIVHGQVVIDGPVEIGSGTVISPFVTIGLRAGDLAAPKIGPHVSIGTGAKVLGDVTIGARARVGANAVVIHDVPEATTVVGIPARPVGSSASGQVDPSSVEW